MARKRYSDEDILKLLREIELKLADGDDVQTACRGVSDATYYNWRRRFGGVAKPRQPSSLACSMACQNTGKTDARRALSTDLLLSHHSNALYDAKLSPAWSALVTAASYSNSRQCLVIRGDLASPSFLPWVKRHSHRLGVECQQIHADPARVELRVEGQADLIDALEVGCLLGPFDVWVESIERTPVRLMT